MGVDLVSSTVRLCSIGDRGTMERCRLTLSWFIALVCGSRRTQPKTPPQSGWFLSTIDRRRAGGCPSCDAGLGPVARGGRGRAYAGTERPTKARGDDSGSPRTRRRTQWSPRLEIFGTPLAVSSVGFRSTLQCVIARPLRQVIRTFQCRLWSSVAACLRRLLPPAVPWAHSKGLGPWVARLPL
jgi:hypothetical protein